VLLPHPARALAAATLLCAVTTGARIAGAQTTADTTAAPTARPAPRPDSARAQRLQGVTVSAVRQRGYAARTTTTATRTSTRLRDVPQTVGVVTRALIADQAMQNMTDVARYVPGVTMGQGEGHRDAPPSAATAAPPTSSSTGCATTRSTTATCTTPSASRRSRAPTRWRSGAAAGAA
jgi:outer membrane receptor for monomeric catechols